MVDKAKWLFTPTGAVELNKWVAAAVFSEEAETRTAADFPELQLWR